MPQYWQVTKTRAEQSAAVWALQPTFSCNGLTHPSLLTLLSGYGLRVPVLEAKQTALSGVLDPQRARKDTLTMICVKGAGKMSADLPDTDTLDKELGRRVFPVEPDNSEADLLTRCEAFRSIWEAYDARLGAQEPPAAFTIRGHTLAAFTTLLGTYNAALGTIETAKTDLNGAKTDMENFNRTVDRVIKAWYRMWKDEYPEGTAEGDALRAQVEPEEGQQKPSKLEIAALTNVAGLKVRVEFVPGGGERATVRQLQAKVVGVDGDFKVVRELSVAEVAAGVEIGPFAAGQQVFVRTDVGNSRDNSEIGAEQNIVVA